MNTFKTLFEHYGYTVEQLNERSWIAFNETFCIPYTEFISYGCRHELAGASFLAESKDDILKNLSHSEAIGWDAIDEAYKGTFFKSGGLCNHDHSIAEVEYWLKHIKEDCL